MNWSFGTGKTHTLADHVGAEGVQEARNVTIADKILVLHFLEILTKVVKRGLIFR